VHHREVTTLLIDDLRSFTDGRRAEVARTSAAGVALLAGHRAHRIDELWLDHDLGDDDTIWPVVEVLERAAFENRPFTIGVVVIHSANPAGAAKMAQALRRWDYEVRLAPNAAEVGYLPRVDVAFRIDLGELVDGHHVVTRGLAFTPTGTLLHYAFVPGIEPRPLREQIHLQHWSLRAVDDAGTAYGNPDGGAYASRGGPAPTPGERDLGGHTPATATTLTLHLTRAADCHATGGYVRELTIDLTSGRTTVTTA
jgi:hypothetical protein